MAKIKSLLTLVGILLLGLILRLYHNTDISLWHDEAFSALLIKYPWGEMIYRIGLDVHPPAYYIALRLWHYVLGDSLLSLRGFSVFFGLATAVAAYGFVKAAFKSEKGALIAALFVALNPFQLQYATEARMYTFGAFLAVFAAYLLVKALQEANTKKRVLYFIGFGVIAGLACLTHYYLLFTIAAFCFFGLLHQIYYYRSAWKHYSALFISYAVIVAVFAPWTKWFLYQFKQVGAGYWIPPMDKWSIPTTLWELFLKFPYNLAETHNQILVIGATVFLVLVALHFLWKSTSPYKWLLIFGIVASFGGSLLFLVLAKLKGQGTSVYLVRYFLYTSSFLCILLAMWLAQIKRQWLLYGLVGAYAIANLWSFQIFWHNLDIKTKPGMAAAVAHLQKNLSPADKLFVGTSFEFFNLKYYLSQTPAPHAVIPLETMKSESYSLEDLSEPGAVPGIGRSVQSWPKPLLFTGGNAEVSSMPHFAGTAILTNQDLVPRFETAARPGETVWLLWTNGFGSNKPPVPQNWKQVDEAGFAEVRPYVGTWIVITKYVVQ